MSTEAPPNPNTAVAPRTPMAIGSRGLEITDLDSLWRLSNYISKSGLAPKGIETPEAIFTAVELGLELGMPPMSALQNIAVINGRPGVYGDMPLALVRASGLLEDYSEEEFGKPFDDTYGWRCICKRLNRKFRNSVFTVADAKKAGLWNKQGPWTQYPKRMLMFRARAFLLRDEFGDVLKGIRTVEELSDMTEQERFERAKNITIPTPAPSAPTGSQLPPPPATPTAKHPTLVEEPLSADEAAEATAGLAPEQKPAEAEATEQQNAGTQLGEFMVANGITWDTFRAYGEKQGYKVNWEAVDGFESLGVMEANAAEGFWTVRERIAKQIAKAKAEGRV